MTEQPEWILVRHGETEWTEKNLLHGGGSDSPLSAKGREQAQLTAQKLTDEKISLLYSSPQGRAVETAKYIGESLGLNPMPVDGFREYYFGWLEGKPLFDFSADGRTPKILRPIIDFIMQLTGEGHRAFYSRIKDGVQTIHQHKHDSPIIIVTHWGVLSVIAALLVEENLDEWRENAEWAACGISRLKPDNGRWEFVEKNNTDHLKKIGYPS
jgi:probable phosphoglycerate mutase